MKKNKTLADQYREVCNAYRDALNEMWETDGDWDDDCDWFDVADCVIGLVEVREIVDHKVDFDTFHEWYVYNMQIHYGQVQGYREARRINLHSWVYGFPEYMKVSKETRDAWEREYWNEPAENFKVI